jgi:hypothetical protein
MPNLICWCPETQQPVNLQIYTDYVTLALIWSNPVRFECPHCAAKHETTVGAAGLQTTLARTSSSEMHEALTKMHEAFWSHEGGRRQEAGDQVIIKRQLPFNCSALSPSGGRNASLD